MPRTTAWGLTNLYIFQGGISGPDGGTPSGGLIVGTDGNYYGTTLYGGTGGGVLFEVTHDGTESIVYAFSGAQDGQLPSKPIQGPDGNFYGTAYWGGGPDGYGIIYKVTPSGEETILQSFTNTNGGPANPGAGLTVGADGDFYGTSTGGGTSGQGTFFRITPAGVLTVLYSFSGEAGTSPAAELIQIENGEFFRYRSFGRKQRQRNSIQDQHGGQNRRLARICRRRRWRISRCPADAWSRWGLLWDHTGGRIWRLRLLWTAQRLWNRVSGDDDGRGKTLSIRLQDIQPMAVPRRVDWFKPRTGLLYGTTDAGGFSDAGNCSSGCGTVFSLTTTGTEQIIYSCGEPPQPWYYQCWVPLLHPPAEHGWHIDRHFRERGRGVG